MEESINDSYSIVENIDEDFIEINETNPVFNNEVWAKNKKTSKEDKEFQFMGILN